MELLKVLGNIRKKRVLVVGDLILDRFIWGSVCRISPEAPVPVVEVTSESDVLGGAANVANNIVALGGHATVIGVVGADRSADLMHELCVERGINVSLVEDKRPTTVKTRIIAHSQQVVRIDQEDTEKVGGRALKGLVAHIKDAVKEHDAVIVSDYKKGVINSDTMRAVLGAAKGRKFVAVDPKMGHFHLYKGASIATPNLMEASSGAAMEISDERSLKEAGQKLMRKLGLKALLITRGEDGMSLFQPGKVTHIPTVARKVYDVTGAGDTVVATFAMAKAAGAGMQEAAMLANHAAGIVVGEVGTATATPARLRQALRSSKLQMRQERLG